MTWEILFIEYITLSNLLNDSLTMSKQYEKGKIKHTDDTIFDKDFLSTFKILHKSYKKKFIHFEILVEYCI